MTYSDPYVPQFPKMRKYSFDLDSVELTPEVLQQADCVLIATNHDDFDYEMIRANAKIIVDTRGGVQRACRSYSEGIKNIIFHRGPEA